VRRKDREITDWAEMIGVLEKCDVCRLGLVDEGGPYIVPLNFGYEYDAGVLTLYFHGAREGRKLAAIRRQAAVCFEADCSHRLAAGDRACAFTMEYESVMGRGTAEMVSDEGEKERGLQLIMRHYAPGRAFAFTAAEVASVAVFKVTAAEFTGKRLTR
jgi:nitroimidazol reductase NimA-like FMN-containing flavoprotein (pyridoxamine 5'-phosphate oxidase superfamily)